MPLNFIKKSLSFAKKAIIVLSVYFLVISLFSYFINKDRANISNSYDPIKSNREEIYKVIKDKKLNSTEEGKVTLAAYRFMMCSMIGEGCSDNPLDGDKNYEKSLFGFMSKMIIAPYSNPPASGIYWAYDGLQQAGFIPKTYAAEGIGFAAIKPFSNLWKIFRDLSYMLLVVVLISIGFMIMFRMKMNPQTVISVENALPRIIVALILITFSFAIAGFLIDLVYILIGLIVSIMIQDPAQSTQFKNEYMLSSGADLFRDIRVRFETRSIGAALGSAFTQIIPLPVYLSLRSAGGIVFIFLMKWVLTILPETFSGILGLAGAGLATVNIGTIFKDIIQVPMFGIFILILFLIGFIYVVPWLVTLVIGASVLFLFFRIFLMLITNYLKLIVNIVIAPLLLLMEAVPGKNAFKFWIMNIIGNLIAYPVMIFVFLLSYVIIFKSGSSAAMTARLPYLYGIDSDSFRLIIGLGLIFLIPDFVKTTKEVLGIKELPFSIGFGTFFGGVSTAAGGGVGLLGQIGSISLGVSGIKSLQGMGKDFFGGLAKPKTPSAPPTEASE